VLVNNDKAAPFLGGQALIALFATRRIPARQPSAAPTAEPATEADAADQEAVHDPGPR
jgi:hypothetical protein